MSRVVLSPYQPGEAPALARLFYATVHSACTEDYSQAEIDAWASGKIDAAAWEKSLSFHYTLVARADGEIAGFAELDGSEVRRIFVHHKHLGEGIGKLLLDAMEQKARENGSRRISIVTSRTAQPFLESRGWSAAGEQKSEVNGARLSGILMEKTLD